MGVEVDAVGSGDTVGCAEGLAVGFEEGLDVSYSAAINENEIAPLFCLSPNLSLPGAPTASVFEFTAVLRPNSEYSFNFGTKLESSMV